MRKLLYNHEIRHIGNKRTRIGKYDIERSYEHDPLEIVTYDGGTDFLINPSIVGTGFKKWQVRIS